MKNLLLATIGGLLFLTSCADKKQNREEFKEEHNKEALRNNLGDSAVAHSESAQTVTDTIHAQKDTSKKK
ncbi:hypothetical protein D1632_08010 [Chryseobacterium nematophagum]|uniref:Lipoprotein n=1 Tax=Chryseobacterium nematophagum TaxID=2305228 RepID=A0A3M7LDK5_9FLAO|nr:hypothetical protein [Chryseobacterium nematophagum]RMZ59566.1 hypothetical protein D1632_08010 [Chryseobacterium nematophagum]